MLPGRNQFMKILLLPRPCKDHPIQSTCCPTFNRLQKGALEMWRGRRPEGVHLPDLRLHADCDVLTLALSAHCPIRHYDSVAVSLAPLEPEEEIEHPRLSPPSLVRLPALSSSSWIFTLCAILFFSGAAPSRLCSYMCRSHQSHKMLTQILRCPV